MIRRHDAALAKQLREALANIALNTAEAQGRCGGDRLHHFRIALGSLRESNAVLDVAIAFGWLERAPLAAERDRLGGLLYGPWAARLALVRSVEREVARTTSPGAD